MNTWTKAYDLIIGATVWHTTIPGALVLVVDGKPFSWAAVGPNGVNVSGTAKSKRSAMYHAMGAAIDSRNSKNPLARGALRQIVE